jgi:hypothetical protein
LAGDRLPADSALVLGLRQFSRPRIPLFFFWRRLPPALHDHVHDIHQHGLVILVQGGGSELDQALRLTRL